VGGIPMHQQGVGLLGTRHAVVKARKPIESVIKLGSTASKASITTLPKLEIDRRMLDK
jgi:hypothetical protein